VAQLLRRALAHPDGLGHLKIAMDDAAVAHLAAVCEGDGRRALNALEIAALTTARVRTASSTSPRRDGGKHPKESLVYDHDEDGHYDTISAFIKSVRGSDPTRRSTGWPRCSMRGRTRASWRAGWSSWPAKTSATPIRAV
jgi:putative ATPase